MSTSTNTGSRKATVPASAESGAAPLRELLERVFVAPDGTNAERLRPLLVRAVDQAMQWSASGSRRWPVPVGEVPIPDPSLPLEGREPESIFRDIDVLLAGAMNPASPGYMGHMDPLPSVISVVGDLLAAVLNNNMLSEEMSPTFTRLERELLCDIAQAFGLGAEAGGVMTSGGSLANLEALTVARNVKLGTFAEGWRGSGRAVLFASESAHTSLEKAAMILGLGTTAVCRVATDGESRMDVAALERGIAACLAAGDRPFAVVGTAGTTVTGSIDPLPALADVCQRHELWYHVDAAYGGALVFSEGRRPLLMGIDRADSITFNPQKWCYVTKTCAMCLFKRRAVLGESFQILHPYMRGSGTGGNIGEVSVQGTRSPEVLKLWLTLQHLGRRGLERLVERSFELAGVLSDRVRERPHLELAAGPHTGIVCFRPRWKGLSASRQDEATAALQLKLMQSNLFLSLPRYRGRLWLKAVLLNPFTDDAVFTRLFEILDPAVAAAER